MLIVSAVIPAFVLVAVPWGVALAMPGWRTLWIWGFVGSTMVLAWAVLLVGLAMMPADDGDAQAALIVGGFVAGFSTIGFVAGLVDQSRALRRLRVGIAQQATSL